MNRQIRILLLALLSCIITLVLDSNGWSQSSVAGQLNQDGFSLLQNGAATEALSAWQEAEELYRAEGNKEGIIGTQLNQALAQQSLGLYPRACSTVAQAITLPKQICESNQGSESVTSAVSKVETTEVNLLGIRLLGESLTLLGNLAEAKAALDFAQTFASAEPAEANRVALALGNVHRLRFKEAMQIYKRAGSRDTELRRDTTAQINSAIADSIAQYQSANDTKANLNFIDLFTDVHQSLGSLTPQSALALPELQQLDLIVQAAYTSLNEDSFAQLPAVDAIYGRLNLAKNLIAIVQNQGFGTAFLSTVTTADIEPFVSVATAEAERINDMRALSFAHGVAAELKALKNASSSEVKADYSQALAVAQSIRAPDAAYEWAYKLALLEEETGSRSAAEQYYKSSIAALSQVREDLISVNTELRFDFSEKIEPVYQDYMRFLVLDDNLAQAVAIHDSLQLAQLENFLRCGRLPSASEPLADQVSIHVINFKDAVEVIVSNQQGIYGYSLPGDAVLQAARNLVLNIQSPSFVETPEAKFLPYSQLLYDQLLTPAMADGLISSSDRLSFILDAPFRAIPMGLLHDGQQYLAATHALSTSLQLRIPDTESARNRALFAGITEQAPSFVESRLSSLPETEFEAESVKGYVRSKVLLNDEFTVDRLRQALGQDSYKIVHISTHGQFSSAPERTYLAAWNELIDFQEMEGLFQGAGSIDLLVLSTCQSAADDDRSTLGLAGIAVRSSARSAIASLWLVDSVGSSVLIDRFYQAKSQGLSTPDSLQRAQTELIGSSTFSHPFYWAPFIFISG